MKTESETDVKSDHFVEGCLLEIQTVYILKQKGKYKKQTFQKEQTMFYRNVRLYLKRFRTFCCE